MLNTRHQDTWLFTAFCTLIVWAPLPLGSNRPWSEFFLYACIWALLLSLAWLGIRGQISPSVNLIANQRLLILLIAIPSWTALQLLPLPSATWQPVSLDTSAGIQNVQASLAMAALFAITLQLVNSERRLKTLALVIVATGVMQACYAALTVMGGHEFDVLGIDSPYVKQGSATGTFINRNHLAGYLEMSLAIGIGLMVASIEKDGPDRKTWREWLRGLLKTLLGAKTRQRLLLVVMVIALVMTHSRMGNAAFFSSMGVSALIGYFIFRHRSRGMVLLFGSMVLIDLFIVSSWFGLERLAQRIEATADSREGRLGVNIEGLEWLKDHWLTGSGAGSFTTVFTTYRGPDVVGFYTDAHNDYLQIMGEYGLIGSLLFAGIAIVALLTSIQAQRKRHTPLMRGMAFGSMMGIISILIHSFTDFNLQIPANAALFTILCAIPALCLKLDSDKARKRKHHRSEHMPVEPASTIQTDS